MEKAFLNRLPLFNKLDLHMQEVVQGTVIAFWLKVLGAGLLFCFNVLLARILGAEGGGIYFLALTITTIATLFGRMGLDNALLRFTAAGVAVKNWVVVKGVYQKGMMIALVISVTSAIAMFIMAPWLAKSIFVKPELVSPMRWMALAVVPMSFVYLHVELLKGLKRILDSQLLQNVSLPTLSLIGVYLLGRIWGVKGAVWAYTFAAILTALLGYRMWCAATPQLQNVTGHFETRQLLHSSMPLFWIALMNLAMNQTATFMLGIWGTKADVGIFAIANRTAMLTSFIMLAVNSIAAPKFAALYKQGDMKTLDSTARNSTKLMTAMVSPLLLVFILFPEKVMKLFGPQFLEGATALMILSVGQLVNVIIGPVGYLLIMSGHEKSFRNNLFAFVSLNILLNFILIPKYGIIGTSIATTFSVVMMKIVAMILVYWKLSIVILPIPRRF